jgi:nitrile hydratase
MNSAHDLGGMMGFGPIAPELDGPGSPAFGSLAANFHEHWETRIFALTLAMGAAGKWNIDISRHARESLPPAQYLSSSYYQIWFAGLEKLLLSADLVSREELDQGKSLVPAKPVKGVLRSDQVMDVMMAGSPYMRPPGTEARFKAGDRIMSKNLHPEHHTRIPRYARGKPGIIQQVHGVHVFADSNAHGKGEDPQWLYKVKFSARDIWGVDHPSNDLIFVDLWEPYLDPR